MFLMAVMFAACGKSNTVVPTGTTGVIAVTVTPSTASVGVGKTQQFTATVTGTSNVTVSWKVNDVVGGNSTLGTISTAGLYTAPATAPNPNTVTITAVSEADATKNATANLTINAPISISPTSANVAATQTLQFSSTVTFSTNTDVTWQVNGTTGGDSTHGTISTAGLYTAPNVVPNPRTVTVTVISKADTSKTASAIVTITVPPIVITPATVTLPAGGGQLFSATAGSNTINPVWTVTCQSQAPNGCGSISSTGQFLAPTAPPPGGTITVNAAVTDGSAAPSNAIVTIQFSNTTLFGLYAFTLTNQVGAAFTAEAGSVFCDGAGNVTSGQIDRVGSFGVPITVTGGSYTVGTDGRGSITVKTASGSETWNLVVVNQNQALIALMDGNKLSGSGSMDFQTLVTGLAPLTGKFALSLHGVNSGPSPKGFAMAGSLVFDGAGSILRGIVDANVNGTVTTNGAATGSYTGISGSGRSAVTFQSPIGPLTFAFYLVDADHFKVIETDNSYFAGGDLVRQPAGPFNNASFNSRFAFTMGGIQNGVIGGVFTMNGNGGITNRVIDGASQVAFDNQGGYTVTDSATGRTTINWTIGGTSQTYALYPRNDGGFAMVEIDALNAGSGLVQRQTLTTPSVISVIGSFAIGLSGKELSGTGGQEIATGVINLTGSTTNIQGTIDFQNATTTTAGGTIQAGAFTVDIATGRGITTLVSSSQVLSGGQLILYLLDTNHALVLESDGQRVLSGVLTKQF